MTGKEEPHGDAQQRIQHSCSCLSLHGFWALFNVNTARLMMCASFCTCIWRSRGEAGSNKQVRISEGAVGE